MLPCIAIADDDLAFANYLKTFLESLGYQARIYDGGEDLVAAVRRGDLPDVALLDVLMPGMDGLTTLRHLKAACGDLQVIMLSGREQASTIVEAFRLGAINYVVKPDAAEGLGEIALDTALKQALEKNRLVSEVAELRRQVLDHKPHAFFVPEERGAMRDIAVMIDCVADSDITVLIRGESGVGKELVARAIHDRSPRGSQPFVKVNCAALPDELLESELFGHEKGSFTGASALRIGKFEQAHNGTLMLDEIGEMKPSLQGKLLHVLQDGEFNRLGSNKRIAADVRVIAATHRNLETMMQQRDFREDLYYRIRVIEIVVPPLRERGDEIPGLLDFFIDKYTKRYNRPQPVLSPAIRDALQRHSWPGNVRELENVVKRFVILQDEALLRLDLRAAGLEHTNGSSPAPHLTRSARGPDHPVFDPRANGAPPHDRPMAGAESNAAAAAGATPTSLSLASAAREAMAKAERDLIIPTLRRVHWNRRKAAPLLGISYKTLLNKIREHGIVPD